MDIAIIGIGLHPFGRHEGVSAIEMGVIAAERALKDAGIGWNDVQLACAGSLEVLQPDTMIKHMGLTGIPFTTLYNGCATGGNLLITTANAIRAGVGDIGIAVGLDKHPRSATIPRATWMKTSDCVKLWRILPRTSTARQRRTWKATVTSP